ncbi:hypothetical protein Taro_004356 [Colocasia esculenta]|uniref:Uncharacterized protein n=1 Tax=Colocasia esculenta TaxID=4460 RepID=A0A843TRF4_COLES|nr:hypothetical protein [Colocasia esculenta]
MKWFNKEMGSMKSMLSEILKVVGAQAPPPPLAQPSKGNEKEVARPSRPSDQESGPSVPEIVSQAAAIKSGPSRPEIVSPVAPVESGPSGPSDQGSGPSGPVGSEQILAEEAAVALEPPAPSPTQTPTPSSLPSAYTAPPAPQPFKQPQPRTISSPTPFPTHSSSPPVSHISPPPPLSEVPPASSARASSSSAESQTEEKWGRSNKALHNKFLLAKSARFPPKDHTLTLSEWFLIHHKDSWAPFIQKEIKLIRHFKMFNDYRYLHRLPEVQLGQFRQAIQSLGSSRGTESIQVDFATLQLPEATFLPPLHSLIMDSSVGSIIFECFARVMGRIKVHKGYLVAFHRFLFREYHQGHVSAEVLAPALSECERLNPNDWIRLYPLSAQQLSDLNESHARVGEPLISEATFLDMNSIYLVNDPYLTWVERYKVYVAMRQDMKHKQIFYPVTLDQFLACASFTKKEQAWEIISHYASLLSLAHYLPVPSQNYCVACVASVVARCVRAVVARLAVDSLVVVFPVWRMIAGRSRFFPGSSLVVSGGGSSHECSVLISGHRCVASVVQSVPFDWAALW